MNMEMRTAVETLLKAARKVDAGDREGILSAVEGVCRAADRTQARQDSDRLTDADRRRLVGARVPVDTAVRYRALADALGISLYRFTANALENERKSQEVMYDLAWNPVEHRYSMNQQT